MQWYSAKQVAKDRGLATATVIGLIDDGLLEAVNVARKGSKRRRFKTNDAMLRDFDERRASKPAPTQAETKSSRRTIQRPVKDYFANVGAE